MAIDVTGILNAGLAAQSAALAVDNLGLIKKKKISSKDFLKQGVKNIVGISLIRSQGNIIQSL